MNPSFFLSGGLPALHLEGHYDFPLIALSYIIAAFASYIVLDLAGWLRNAPDQSKKSLLWLIGGAFVMGSGIWSMHFIGMTALVIPGMPMVFEPIFTSLSFIVAVIASGFALYLIQKMERSQIALIAGGLVLGLAISSMHYLGMEAMKVHVNIQYRPIPFVFSIIIGILASEAALWLAMDTNQNGKKDQFKFKIASAFVMGAAICGMHYTGMAAAVFTPLSHAIPTSLLLSNQLTLFITTATLIVMSVTFMVSKHLIAMVVDQKQEFLNVLLQNLSEGILACDADQRLTVFNAAARTFHGIALDEKVDALHWKNYFQYYYPDTETLIKPSDRPLFRALQDEKLVNVEMIVESKTGVKRNLLVNGQAIYKLNQKLGAVITLHDVTEQKRLEKELTEQATHDILTQLPNRTVLYDRIQQSIALARRTDQIVAILFIDLDRFKMVNDSFGHTTGDLLLIEVAKRLKNALRESDTIARVGGDEFIAVIMGKNVEIDIIPIIKKMLELFNNPFLIENHEFLVTTSIGISSYPKNGPDAETLVQHADTAMYRIKSTGRNNFQFYTEEMNTRAYERLSLETQLKHAIERNEFILHYQPIVNLDTGFIIGFEALVRWQHPALGLLLPVEFITVAEETGLIKELGEWVLRTACQQNKTWQTMHLPKVKMAVNLSAVQFRQINLGLAIENILKEIGLEGQYLELELTESVIIENANAIMDTLNYLKNLGISLAIDDFGTGYSSLSYLKKFPIDKLKIDRSFINDLQSDSEDAAIVMAVIAMANSLKLRVVAEGAETANQLSFLRLHNCDEIQGYYLSRPLNAEACTQLLKENCNLLQEQIETA